MEMVLAFCIIFCIEIPTSPILCLNVIVSNALRKVPQGRQCPTCSQTLKSSTSIVETSIVNLCGTKLFRVCEFVSSIVLNALIVSRHCYWARTENFAKFSNLCLIYLCKNTSCQWVSYQLVSWPCIVHLSFILASHLAFISYALDIETVKNPI